MSQPPDIELMDADLRDLIMAVPGSPQTVAWGVRPQGTALPGISLQVISDGLNRTYRGHDGSWVSRVQLDVWSKTLLEARRAAKRIAKALDSFKGRAGDTRFTGIYVVDGDTGFEETEAGVIHRARLDLMVHHTDED